jgi:Flp pilus assembly protein TadG
MNVSVMMTRPAKISKQNGAAAVEFALLIIPMLVMVFGITEFGRAMYQYNTLVKLTRDATRYLTTQAAGAGVGAAQCLAVYGNSACTGPTLLEGLTTAMVTECDATNCPGTHSAVATGSGAVNLVTVTIQGYQFQSLVSFTVAGFDVGLPNITFGGVSTTMRQIL